MKIFLNIIKWILIIGFFPLSLLFVAYYQRRQERKEWYKNEQSV